MIPSLKEFFVYPSGDLTPARHIAYTEWGDPNNENIVICVHGLARNSRDFDYIAASLAKNYRVICPDVVGRGQSRWLTDKSLYNYNTYVEDMVALVDYLGGKPVNWIGTSMGGLIAIFMLQKYQYIKKLVLNDIGPFIPKEALQRIAKYVSVNPSFDNLEECKAHLKKILVPFGIQEEEHWDHLTKYGFREENGKYYLHYDPAIGAAAFQDGSESIVDFDAWSLWPNITCPVLVLRGEKSDILNQETYEKMLQTHHDIKGVEIPNVGHTPALLTKDQIAIVTSWFEG
jgi:pimeloyl-ACP methyl ester carboxylesterase